jgi:tripartite-type tricarboxylate transporter receptor subunit TctC
MKSLSAIVVVLALACSASGVWAADDYPSKPIQLVCPFAVGGITDLSARVIADSMGRILGQPMLVVNKPGAASAVGTAFVAASKPDGYTLATTWIAIVLLPLINPNLPYKMNDLTPIGKSLVVEQMLLVNKNLPVNSIPDLVAYAKKHPRTLSYGSAGVGTLPHLMMEMLNAQAQVDIQHIPYNSEQQAATALVGNHVQVAPLSYSATESHIKAGTIRPIAIFSPQRDPRLPQVSSKEQGYPDLLASIYGVMLAPAKTPEAIIKKLEAALEKSLKDRDVREKLEKMEYKVDFQNAKDTKDFLEAEAKKWAPIVKRANIVVK